MVASFAALLPMASPAYGKGDIKIAMVYNIIRFVDFPGASKTLKLCVLSSDPLASGLAELEGRPAGGAKLDVTIVDSPSKLGANCNIIYMDNNAPTDAGQRARGQIIIGASNQFAERGGTVGLIRFGGQTRFAINLRDAEMRGLRFSSQLIQLAAKVIT